MFISENFYEKNLESFFASSLRLVDVKCPVDGGEEREADLKKVETLSRSKASESGNAIKSNESESVNPTYLPERPIGIERQSFLPQICSSWRKIGDADKVQIWTLYQLKIWKGEAR